MTTSIRVLSTFSLDTSPSILLLGPQKSSILINCGEGCQRSFLEAPGLKIRSVTTVCLTHLSHTSVGGLPGMILTTADVAEAAMQNAIQAIAAKGNVATKHPKCNTSNDSDKPGLQIIGPEGTLSYISSLRHFMRREKFDVRIHEGAVFDKGERNNKSKKRKIDNDNSIQSSFYTETIPLRHKTIAFDKEILSFIFTTPPIQGKFLPQKAKELGIPPGPLYTKLKSGETVTFVVNGIEKTVMSQEVVLQGTKGVAIPVIFCPSGDVLSQLQQSEQLVKLKDTSNCDLPTIDAMVHITPSLIFQDIRYQDWIRTFPTNVDHIWIDCNESIGCCRVPPISESAFQSAALGALTRSLIHGEIYPSPIDHTELRSKNSIGEKSDDISIIVATRTLEYLLIPRARKGLVSAGASTSALEIKEAMSLANDSGAIREATTILNSIKSTEGIAHKNGELLFTGTGSAVPCKHRNVSGIVLRVHNGNSMLLDVGEGTIGQLLRANPQRTDYINVLKSIQAVWISHPHADHHLGLLRLLSEQSLILDCEPLILMAPPNLFRFLEEYGEVDVSIQGRYIKVDCRDMVAPNILSPALLTMMKDRLGITGCLAVPVAHCPFSFAVRFDGTPFGRLAYSGDCRPSIQFSEQAIDTDLLIHEATFEDGMEDEAVLKRHSTVSEAIEIGRKMRAKAVVLTHFSQRYPKLPKLKQLKEQFVPIVFAFDFMCLTPTTVQVAAKLTPALRLLYPEEETSLDGLQQGEEEEIPAERILAVPGLFAQKELL